MEIKPPFRTGEIWWWDVVVSKSLQTLSENLGRESLKCYFTKYCLSCRPEDWQWSQGSNTGAIEVFQNRIDMVLLGFTFVWWVVCLASPCVKRWSCSCGKIRTLPVSCRTSSRSQQAERLRGNGERCTRAGSPWEWLSTAGIQKSPAVKKQWKGYIQAGVGKFWGRITSWLQGREIEIFLLTTARFLGFGDACTSYSKFFEILEILLLLTETFVKMMR